MDEMSTWERLIQLITKYPLSFLPDVFLLIGLIAGSFTVNYLGKVQKVIFLFMAVCFGIEIVLVYFATRGWNNYFLVNVTSLIETFFFSIIYWIEIASQRSRVIIVGLLSAYLVLFVYAFQWLRIAEFLLGAERVILFVFVILHLQFILETMRVSNLLAYSMFWVSAGAMIYAAGTFFIFMFTRITFNDPNDMWYWTVTQMFTCMFYTVLAVSFYLRRREVLCTTV